MPSLKTFLEVIQIKEVLLKKVLYVDKWLLMCLINCVVLQRLMAQCWFILLRFWVRFHRMNGCDAHGTFVFCFMHSRFFTHKHVSICFPKIYLCAIILVVAFNCVCVQLRVDGVLMRMRDTRFFCPLKDGPQKLPQVIRERAWREATFAELAAVSLREPSWSLSWVLYVGVCVRYMVKWVLWWGCSNDSHLSRFHRHDSSSPIIKSYARIIAWNDSISPSSLVILFDLCSFVFFKNSNLRGP